MDDNFFDSLPEDDDQAFLEYATYAMEEILQLDEEGDPTYSSVELLRVRLAQLTDVFSVSDKIKQEIIDADEISDYVEGRKFLFIIRSFRDILRLKKSREKYNAVFDTVKIRSEFKTEIRDLIGKIKKKIDIAGLEVPRTESLHNKLNVFLAELDRDRTKLTALTAAFVQVSGAVGEGAEKLDPAIAMLERVMKAIGIGSEERPGLPKPEKQKQLPAPETTNGSGNEPEVKEQKNARN
ncbi:hypothetical protein [Ahrensia kielensis]|uniref:hypothetical protein n=1 Tax=Ahrensia kielensis TaxID=76980 RepID=UPI00037B9C46|nr:hypothetical protein [Ahrensia kielensis]